MFHGEAIGPDVLVIAGLFIMNHQRLPAYHHSGIHSVQLFSGVSIVLFRRSSESDRYYMMPVIVSGL